MVTKTNKKSIIGTIAGLGLGVALAFGIVAGSATEAQALKPRWPGNTATCAKCSGASCIDVTTGYVTCGAFSGNCRNYDDCGGGVWAP